MDETFHQAVLPDADLQEFFSRPIPVRSWPWAVGSRFDVSFNPWTDYFSNGTVQNKLANYYTLTCDLEFSIKISATKFHYSGYLASYNPYGSVADNVNNGTTNLDIQSRLTPRSQRQCFWGDVSNSQGGLMELPFYNLHNAIDVTDFTSFDNIGVIDINSVSDLHHSNGGTNDVTVVAWVQAVNVRLHVPTFSSPFTPQSRFVYQAGDEYEEDGPISGPASTIAGIAGSLADAPIIGPYAKATNIVADAVAGVARFFGFSRPRQLENPSYYVPRPLGTFAATDDFSTATSLALTSKQEQTVDPRTMGGSDIDELALKYICQKESYLTHFNWGVGDASDKILFASGVTPTIMPEIPRTVNGTPARIMSPTALAFAATPFRHWSGSMVFKFRIFKSGFHRGRIRIFYEPDATDILAQPLGTLPTNTNYGVVIDIEKETEVTMKIPWAQVTPYKDVYALPYTRGNLYAPNYDGNIGAPTQTIPGDLFATAESSLNGSIYVQVINPLVSPSSIDPITIAVSVYAGDDFELMVPDSSTLSSINYIIPDPAQDFQSIEKGKDGEFTYQSEMVEEGEHTIQAPPAVLDENTAEFVEESKVDLVNKKSMVFFGEKIVSLRTLLKRRTFHQGGGSAGTSTAGNVQVAFWNLSTFPTYSGEDPNGRYPGQDSGVQMTMLNYVTPAYLGWRGNIRYTFATTYGTAQRSLLVTRTNGVPNYSFGTTNLSGGTLTDQQIAVAIADNLPDGLDGMHATDTRTNAGIEVEVPYYRANRFSIARNYNINQGIALDGSDSDNIRITTISANAATPNSAQFYSWVSAGEDFNLFAYVGAPAYWIPEDG